MIILINSVAGRYDLHDQERADVIAKGKYDTVGEKYFFFENKNNKIIKINKLIGVQYAVQCSKLLIHWANLFQT